MTSFSARDIRVFLAVHRYGAIRAAAAQLSLAPSVVSRHIAEMEAALALPLFDRSARGVSLTEAGTLVLEHCRRAMEEFSLLDEQLADLRGLQQRNIRIICGEGFLADFVQNGLAGILETSPSVRYELRIGSTDAVLAALVNGDSDIGIAYNPPISAGVRSVTSARHPLCAVLPIGHPLAAQARVALADCLGYPIALLPAGHGTTDLLSRVASDSGLALSPRLITTSIDALRRFVAAGLGIAFLPQASIAMEIEAGHATSRELADPGFTGASAHLMIRARRRLPPSVARFVQHLAGTMSSFQERS